MLGQLNELHELEAVANAHPPRTTLWALATLALHCPTICSKRLLSLGPTSPLTCPPSAAGNFPDH